MKPRLALEGGEERSGALQTFRDIKPNQTKKELRRRKKKKISIDISKVVVPNRHKYGIGLSFPGVFSFYLFPYCLKETGNTSWKVYRNASSQIFFFLFPEGTKRSFCRHGYHNRNPEDTLC